MPVNLRKLVPSDLEAVYTIVRDRETMKHVSNRRPWSKERTEKFVNWGVSHPEDLTYAVMEGEDLIGVVQLTEYDFMDCFLKGKLVISIFLRGDMQGKGYGKEAISSLLLLHPDKEIYASIDTKNTRSKVMFEKLGFTRVGTLHYKEGASEVFVAPSTAQPSSEKTSPYRLAWMREQ